MRGLKVLVTRPEPECSNLVQAVQAQGGEAYAFPCLESESADPGSMIEIIQKWQGNEILIFISPRSALFLTKLPMGYLNKIKSMTSIAMGKGTEAVLMAHHFKNIITPKAGSDSEAILDLPVLQQVNAKTIILLKGQTGRELIFETLKSRDARVEKLIVYRMKPTVNDLKPLLQSHAQQPFDVVICTSIALLQAFMEKAGHAINLDNSMVTIMSESMLNLAKSYNIKNWRMIKSAHQQDLISFLQGLNNDRANK
jgi:uroporphyrinogen-III synthase